MKVIKVGLAIVFCLFLGSVAAQKICECDSISLDACKNNFERVEETIMTRPACGNKKATYRTIKRVVIKTPCDPKVYKYSCDCNEKKLFEKNGYTKKVIQTAKFKKIKTYDCSGKLQIVKIMTKPELFQIAAKFPASL